jgi:hypothetical protein
MDTWTNMPWPDDPYRTGQQLYRRPAPRLAAFTISPAVDGQPLPSAVAIVYLPLHRTRAVTVTRQTLTFGFRAASTTSTTDMPGLAAIAGLDLLQARRHAAVLAGHLLAEDLAALPHPSDITSWRAIAAVTGDWTTRHPAKGQALMLDCGLDLPSRPTLEDACRRAHVIPMGGDATRRDGWHPAALAVERALAIALVCATHLRRYDWSGTLSTAEIIAAAAWDCLPWPEHAALASGRRQ